MDMTNNPLMLYFPVLSICSPCVLKRIRLDIKFFSFFLYKVHFLENSIGRLINIRSPGSKFVSIKTRTTKCGRNDQFRTFVKNFSRFK